MTIERISTNLPTTEKIRQLNEQIVELNGKIAQAKFDKNEVDSIYAGGIKTRKFLRDQSLGHTLGNYTGWTHVKEETGYSIWKYAPTNYTSNTLNQVYLDNTLYINKGTATSELSTSFDFVYEDEDGSGSFTDYSSESASEATDEFFLMDETTDYFYFGDTAVFLGIKFEFHTRGSGYDLQFEYWDGSAWTDLTASGHSFLDGTSDFTSDGSVTYDNPGDWATTAINGQTKYWIRVKTEDTPVTVAKAYYIVPSGSAVSLLALSSSDIIAGNWAWCDYSGSVYVTIRNSGSATSEGDFYITSASSAVNLQNFFVYLHHIRADYEDSTYIVGTSGEYKSISVEAPGTSEDITLFYTDVPIIITQLVAVVRGSTPSLTYTVRHSTDRNAVGNEVVTSGSITTSTTSGDIVTIFNDATVPSASFVWLETTARSGTVLSFNLSVYY